MGGLINKIKSKALAFYYGKPKRIISAFEPSANIAIQRENFNNLNPDQFIREKTLYFGSHKIDSIDDLSYDKVVKNCSSIEVFKITKGRYHELYGRCLILEKENILDELSFAGYFEPNKNLVLHTSSFPKAKKLSGKALCICCTGAHNNYFTFHLKLIQRIGFVKKLGWDLKDFDHFLVNHENRAFQTELLKTHGVPLDKVIQTSENCLFECEELIVPSIGLQNIYGLEYLNSLYPNKHLSKSPHKRVYLSRQKAKWMKVTNLDILKPIFEKYDIEIIETEGLTVEEQVKLAQETQILITPHGAGLANIVFMQPNSLVLEIMNKNRIHVGYHAYGIIRKLFYGYTRSNSTNNEHSLGKEATKNLTLNMDNFNEIESIIQKYLQQN